MSAARGLTLAAVLTACAVIARLMRCADDCSRCKWDARARR